MSRKVPLRRLLLYASLPAVLFPLLVLALMGPWQLQSATRTLERDIQEDLLQNAQVRLSLVATIEANMEDATRETAAVWPLLARDPAPERTLEEMASRSAALLQLWVVGPDGRVRHTSHGEAKGRNITKEGYWQEFQANRSLVCSGIQRHEDGRWLIRVVAPTVTGEAIVATYSTDRLQVSFRNIDAVNQDRLSILVDQQGRAIAHSDESQIGQDLSALPPVARALDGHEGTMVFREQPGGPERSAGYVAMPSRGWALVLMQPAATTMSIPAVTVELTLLGLMVASLVIAWLLFTWLSRRLTAPLVTYSAYLERLAGGEEAPDPPAPSGIREPDQMVESAEALYASLNTTIRQLDARTREVALANQQLTASVEDLKRLDRLRTEFLNVLSHDLRIPLTVVVGYAELLQDSPSLGDDEQAHVEAMLATCQRMETMLNEFLDYARLESGRLELHCETFNLAELVEEVQTFFRPLAAQKAQHFTIELEAVPLTVYADPDRVRQVLFNLVSNGIKYTPRGGTVTVQVTNGGALARVRVQDTGVGLSVEDHAHLFEKFYRSRRPEVQAEKGTGLGLVIAQGVLEALGSRLEVESEVGRGATFSFTLPLAA